MSHGQDGSTQEQQSKENTIQTSKGSLAKL